MKLFHNDFSCFYINLDSRLKRNAESMNELAKIKNIFPDVRRFSACSFDIPNFSSQAKGILGCMASHIRCLTNAYSQGKHLLVFEDDIKFINDYENIIKKAINDLPKDWGMLYLGANILKPFKMVSSNLARLTHAQSTHAYMVNYNFIEKLIGYIPVNKVIPIDLIYAEKVVPYNNCYIVAPEMIAVQRDSYSDIEGKNADYESYLEKRYNENIERI